MKKQTKDILNKLLIKYPVLEICTKDIEALYQNLLNCYYSGGKVLVCGNGGSAADSGHIVGELMKGFLKPRKLIQEQALKFEGHENILGLLQQTIPAISLCEHTALISAIGNDTGGEMVFAQQVYGYGKENDILIAISTSGSSTNTMNAIYVAKALGMKTISLTGESGGKSKEIADISICVPEKETYLIQELHLPIYHAVCAMIEEELFA